MKVVDRSCLIQLDKQDSDLWYAFGFLLNEMIDGVEQFTEDQLIYDLLNTMKNAYDDVNEKSIELFDVRG